MTDCFGRISRDTENFENYKKQQLKHSSSATNVLENSSNTGMLESAVIGANSCLRRDDSREFKKIEKDDCGENSSSSSSSTFAETRNDWKVMKQITWQSFRSSSNFGLLCSLRAIPSLATVTGLEKVIDKKFAHSGFGRVHPPWLLDYYFLFRPLKEVLGNISFSAVESYDSAALLAFVRWLDELAYYYEMKYSFLTPLNDRYDSSIRYADRTDWLNRKPYYAA